MYRQITNGQALTVAVGERVLVNQVMASTVRPTVGRELVCPGTLPQDHIPNLLASREKTQRFTGVKLARLRADSGYLDVVESLAGDGEEDIYVRLEAVAYLSSICGHAVQPLIQPYLDDTDPQNQLEAVITLAECATSEAVHLLSSILDDASLRYFLRSAAAWALGRVGSPEAVERLIRAFSDVTPEIREEALEGIVRLDGSAVPRLLASLTSDDMAIASGAAEAVRQVKNITDEDLTRIAQQVRGRNPRIWPVWLLGNLPRARVNGVIADLQDTAPELHYALSLLWSFCESWIARQWDLSPSANFPVDSTMDIQGIEERNEGTIS